MSGRRYPFIAGLLIAGVLVAGGLVLGAGSSIASATTAPGATASLTGTVGAASEHPGLQVHVYETVSPVPPSEKPAYARSAVVVAPRTAIKCGQYLTEHLYAAYEIPITNTVVTSLSSTDYTQWCSGKVYTESYEIYCNHLVAIAVNISCLSGWTSGQTGQGSSAAGVWYNQPVVLSYLSFPLPQVKRGISYCRNQMHSNGTVTNWCTITWS